MDIFGALPFIYGTVASSVIAILIAAPVSIGVALFLVELAPRRLAKLIGFLVEMLAAIPSVVYGLWGIFILAPWMQHRVQPWLTLHLGPDSNFALSLGRVLTVFCYPFVLFWPRSHWTLNATAEACQEFAQKIFAGPNYGVGLLTASFILAIMITPTISSISREIFGTVSASIREAALALGATRWEMIRMAVLKTSRSGLLGAVILGLGRALGETMAVTMVIGNRNEIKAAIMAPAQTMASVIANEYPEASGLHISSLAAIGLALFAVSLVINSVARLIIWQVERGRH
jgi:phosphate transport system permease protein